MSRERGPKCLERTDPISVLSEDVMEHGMYDKFGRMSTIGEAQLLSAVETSSELRNLLIDDETQFLRLISHLSKREHIGPSSIHCKACRM